jgi:hypothetical protein
VSIAALVKPILSLGAEDMRLAGGATHIAAIKCTDLASFTATASTPTGTLELFDVEDGDVVSVIGSRLKTAFSDASDGAFNSTLIQVGDGGSVARFLVSQEVNLNGTEILAKEGVAAGYAYTGADTVDIKFTSTAGKALSDLDAGEVHIYFRIAKLGKVSTAFRD